MAALLSVYCVPVAAAVRSAVEPSAYAAVTVSWTVAPSVVSVRVDAAIVIDAGIGVAEPKMILGMLTMPFGGSRNGWDSPDTVWPSMMHVARARTSPKFAGTLGSTHDPSGFTRTLRLRTLTVQFSLSCCANALWDAHTSRNITATVRSGQV